MYAVNSQAHMAESKTKLVRIYKTDEARIKSFGTMGDTFPDVISRIVTLAEKYRAASCEDTL